MPPLQRPRRAILATIPARQVPVHAETDVLVVGGGHAGLGAAVGAAKAGAKVLLVERFGTLGGAPSSALMMPLMSFHRQMPPVDPPPPDALLPTGQGPDGAVIGGVFREFLDRLVAARGAVEPSEKTGFLTLFDPQVLRAVALDLLDAHGVRYLFYSTATGVLKEDGKLSGVVFASKDGPFVVRAKVIVDATGDGDVAAFAGVPYAVGRAKDGLTEPVSLFFRVGNFYHAAFAKYVKENSDDWKGGVRGLGKLIAKAEKAGDLKAPGEHVMIFKTLQPKEVLIDFARVTRMRGANLFDMARAEAESRRQLIEIMIFLRKYVPGFRDAYAVDAGATLVVREYRRVTGEYVLTKKDILGARKFPDVVARNASPIDAHQPLPLGEAYDIPYRCLVPLKAENLLLSGRCLSGDEEAQGSYRISAACMATGHAAGVAAALSANTGVRPRKLDVGALQAELIRQKADLGDGEGIGVLNELRSRGMRRGK